MATLVTMVWMVLMMIRPYRKTTVSNSVTLSVIVINCKLVQLLKSTGSYSMYIILYYVICIVDNYLYIETLLAAVI